MALLAAAQAAWPSVNLAPLAGDPPAVRKLTELRYLSVAAGDLGRMSVGWAPLDVMTRDGAGLTVYEAADKDEFWTAPTFGVELQNRIWNFQQAPTADPEAFFYHLSPKDLPEGQPLYIGREIPRTAVATDPRFRLVAASENGATTLYVSTAALAEKGRWKRLVEYYRLTAPRAVVATAQIAAAMTPDSIVLVPFPLAAGFIVHQEDGLLKAEVTPVVTADLPAVVERLGRRRTIYTLDAQITGMKNQPVTIFKVSGKGVTLVRNEPLPPAGPQGAQP